jgi:hypothetical protein
MVSFAIVSTFEPSHTLKFDLVLNDQRLSFGVNCLCKLGRDGMMGSLVLDYQALVALHALEDSWLLNGPVANVRPLILGS